MSHPLFPRIVRRLAPLVLAVTLTDCATKRAAEKALVSLPDQSYDVLGNVIRFRLVYNRVGAMGISFGEWSRPVLITCTIIILFVLVHWYQHLQEKPRWVLGGLALVIGGALGNLVDRLLAHRGVVDFIDIGIGSHRFWIFNVADIAVTIGAGLLAIASIKFANRTAASI